MIVSASSQPQMSHRKLRNSRSCSRCSTNEARVNHPAASAISFGARGFGSITACRSPRKGRVLLCGDAAHVHSPAGGQGMNTGIQDSVALADVLAESARGANESRLDVWATKRHEVASGVVSLTDRLTRTATMKSGIGRAFRNIGMTIAGSLPPVRAAMALRLAELDHR